MARTVAYWNALQCLTLALSLYLSLCVCAALLSWAWSTSLLALIKLLSLISQLELRFWWVTAAAATTSLTKPDAFRSGHWVGSGLVCSGRHLCTFCTFWANKSVSQLAWANEQSRVNINIWTTYVVGCARVIFFVSSPARSAVRLQLLWLFVCCCWLFKDQLGQTKHMASKSQTSWAACGMRHADGRICVCLAYKFSLWLLPNQQKFLYSVKQHKNEANQKKRRSNKGV